MENNNITITQAQGEIVLETIKYAFTEGLDIGAGAQLIVVYKAIQSQITETTQEDKLINE